MTLYMRYPAIIQQGVCFDFRKEGRTREKREIEVNERNPKICFLYAGIKVLNFDHAVIFIISCKN